MNQLLAQALARHGGSALWQSLAKLSVRLKFGGLAFASRFQFTGGVERHLEISTRTPKVVFHDYPRAQQRGVFTPDLVWMETQTGARRAERFAPRDAFRSLRHHVWWDDLDMLYFAGYASWNYFTTPFLLAQEGVASEEIAPWRENGETWRRLSVSFPANIPTHCREQIFYFDESLLLRRFDYTPEVFGAWARAAHYCFAHENFGGLLFPTKRKVLPASPTGASRSWPTLVWIEVKGIEK